MHATHPPPLHTHTCTNTHAHMHTYTHTHSLSLTYTHIQPHTRTHTPHIHTHTTCTHTHSMQVRGRRVWREKRDRSLSHACTASKPTCPTAGNAATQGACVLIGLHVLGFGQHTRACPIAQSPPLQCTSRNTIIGSVLPTSPEHMRTHIACTYSKQYLTRSHT